MHKDLPLNINDVICVLDYVFGGFDYSINESNAIVVLILSNMWLINVSGITKCENEICKKMDENSMLFCAELGYMTKNKAIIIKAAEKLSEFGDRIVNNDT